MTETAIADKAAAFTRTEHLDGKVTLYGGDNRDVLKSLPDNSIDSICTDPPYALVSIVKRFGKTGSAPTKDDDVYARASAGFMGKQWDTGEVAFSEVFWAECLRVLKPGGHVVAFSGTRTYHRMAVAIEDAGFEIRDDVLNMVATDSVVMRFVESLNEAQTEAFFKLMEESQFGGMAAWTYGSGFPKSHDVSKAIDKHLGAERAKKRYEATSRIGGANTVGGDNKGAGRPWIDAAKERGYHEVADDNPITEPARQWQGWGTALKPAWEPICLARKPLVGTVAANVLEHGTGALNIDGCRVPTDEHIANHGHSAESGKGKSAFGDFAGIEPHQSEGQKLGRWPANIVHDGSDEVLAAFPDTKSTRAEVTSKPGAVYGSGAGLPSHTGIYGFDDSGSAARFFYTAKADKLDRIGSKHPTVKPVDLMQWLVRLVTPKGGLCAGPIRRQRLDRRSILARGNALHPH